MKYGAVYKLGAYPHYGWYVDWEMLSLYMVYRLNNALTIDGI